MSHSEEHRQTISDRAPQSADAELAKAISALADEAAATVRSVAALRVTIILGVTFLLLGAFITMVSVKRDSQQAVSESRKASLAVEVAGNQLNRMESILRSVSDAVSKNVEASSATQELFLEKEEQPTQRPPRGSIAYEPTKAKEALKPVVMMHYEARKAAVRAQMDLASDNKAREGYKRTIEAIDEQITEIKQ